jgi:hypothetical protein
MRHDLDDNLGRKLDVTIFMASEYLLEILTISRELAFYLILLEFRYWLLHGPKKSFEDTC